MPEPMTGWQQLGQPWASESSSPVFTPRLFRSLQSWLRPWKPCCPQTATRRHPSSFKPHSLLLSHKDEWNVLWRKTVILLELYFFEETHPKASSNDRSKISFYVQSRNSASASRVREFAEYCHNDLCKACLEIRKGFDWARSTFQELASSYHLKESIAALLNKIGLISSLLIIEESCLIQIQAD